MLIGSWLVWDDLRDSDQDDGVAVPTMAVEMQRHLRPSPDVDQSASSGEVINQD